MHGKVFMFCLSLTALFTPFGGDVVIPYPLFRQVYLVYLPVFFSWV